MDSEYLDAVLIIAAFAPLVVMLVLCWSVDRPKRNRKRAWLYLTLGHRVEGLLK